MSRLIVKNLPLKLNEKKFKEKLASYGTVTDLKLLYTESGKFRRFAFVGFLHNVEAEKALHGLNKSMLQNQCVTAEICTDLGCTNKTNEKVVIKNKTQCGSVERPNGECLDVTRKQTKTSSEDQKFLKSKTVTRAGKALAMQSLSYDHAVKMKGCPFNITEEQIVEFFFPLKPQSISIHKNKHGTKTGLVIVNFSSSGNAAEALKLNGGYIKNRYIELSVFTQHNVGKRSGEKSVLRKEDSNEHKDCNIEDIMEFGRIFVRNLSYACVENDIETLFTKYGPLSEVNLLVDNLTKKCVGYAFVTFMLPEHALNAFNELDGSVFQGRILHILPAKPREDTVNASGNAQSSFKKEKQASLVKTSSFSHNWNTLFIGTNAVAEAIAEQYDTDKTTVLESSRKHSAAVRVALGETQLVQQTKDFLLENGVCLEAFSKQDFKRSKTVIIVKNLTVGATCTELRKLFEQHAELGRVLLAPAGVTAVVECLDSTGAKNAFVKLAYRKFHRKPLFLEWAPENVFAKVVVSEEPSETKSVVESTDTSEAVGTTLFVKNLNFSTTEESLKAHFETCGKVTLCRISKKKTHKTEELLSMGYGFVQFKQKADAQNALKTLQSSLLDDHTLELKYSHRKVEDNEHAKLKLHASSKEPSSKILVRNVPFQANKKEIYSLFKSFGELRSVRLPHKASIVSTGSSSHRGFAFVDFVTEDDAKRAFKTLCASTHLYGRRLVLEWADSKKDSVDSLRRKTAEKYVSNPKKRKEHLEQAICDAENEVNNF